MMLFLDGQMYSGIRPAAISLCIILACLAPVAEMILSTELNNEVSETEGQLEADAMFEELDIPADSDVPEADVQPGGTGILEMLADNEVADPNKCESDEECIAMLPTDENRFCNIDVFPGQGGMCQCRDGYKNASSDDALSAFICTAISTESIMCTSDEECMTMLPVDENRLCKLNLLGSGTCQCRDGFENAASDDGLGVFVCTVIYTDPKCTSDEKCITMLPIDENRFCNLDYFDFSGSGGMCQCRDGTNTPSGDGLGPFACTAISNETVDGVRLEGGSWEGEGRLELLYNGTWGTVCDTSFNDYIAGVVCVMLGHEREHSKFVPATDFGQGQGPIHLEMIWCGGHEVSLTQCSNSEFGLHSARCTHETDVGISCRKEDQNKCTSDEKCITMLPIDDNRFCNLDYFDHPGLGGMCQCRDGYKNTPSGDALGPFVCTAISNETVDGVRLVGGSWEGEGRLELLYNGTWGTVCDSNFEENTAGVVCVMLGHQRGHSKFVPATAFGQGQGPIHLEMIWCRGYEVNLTQCSTSEFGVHSARCTHDTDVGISCHKEVTLDGVRLVDGQQEDEGRLELLYNGTWGTVCDTNFDDYNARVVCLILGYESEHGKFVPAINFGSGEGPIYLDKIWCGGGEVNLMQCSNSGFGVHSASCTHDTDVGISCHKEEASTIITSIHLAGGNSANEGRLELLYNGAWGTVCDTNFDDYNARVVCLILGFGNENSKFISATQFGPGEGPILLDNIWCSGAETDIMQCSNSGFGAYSARCSQDTNVGISCQAQEQLTVDGLRLVGGTWEGEGRLELLYDGVWGTACGTELDHYEAGVVCVMLGYLRADGRVIDSTQFGPVFAPIHMYNIACSGAEVDISMCSHSLLGTQNCTHDIDVGISCYHETVDGVRLVGERWESEGRLEVLYNGTWGTVCDGGFDNYEAGVVCLMLGYMRSDGLFMGPTKFGPGKGPIYLDNIGCTGYEDDLMNCYHSPLGSHSCTHDNDVGMSCYHATLDGVRLVGGTWNGEGRLDLLYNGTWGTVCDTNFDAINAGVACFMLGYLRGNSQVVDSTQFEQGPDPIYLDNVWCSGQETDIMMCSHYPFGVHSCTHENDVAISCNKDVFDGVRLVGGRLESEGRLELLYNGTWGTVCDSGFNNIDAVVACFMLGYGRLGGHVISTTQSASEDTTIHLENVACLGVENSIMQCGFLPIGVHNCTHDTDVSISCNQEQENATLCADSTCGYRGCTAQLYSTNVTTCEIVTGSSCYIDTVEEAGDVTVTLGCTANCVPVGYETGSRTYDRRCCTATLCNVKMSDPLTDTSGVQKSVATLQTLIIVLALLLSSRL